MPTPGVLFKPFCESKAAFADGLCISGCGLRPEHMQTIDNQYLETEILAFHQTLVSLYEMLWAQGKALIWDILEDRKPML